MQSINTSVQFPTEGDITDLEVSRCGNIVKWMDEREGNEEWCGAKTYQENKNV